MLNGENYAPELLVKKFLSWGAVLYCVLLFVLLDVSTHANLHMKK